MIKKILIVGCGDIGIRLAKQLSAKHIEIWGLRRNSSTLPRGIKGISADVCKPETLAPLYDIHFDVVLFTLTPGESNDERYQQVYVDGTANVLAALNADYLKRVLFVSSTGVYHQSQGECIDEFSETNPSRFSGKRLLEAEQICSAHPVPSTIIRFAGIYGAKSTRLIDNVLQGKPVVERYSNRIHREDCAGFIAHLLNMPDESLQACYIGVDNEPVKMSVVNQWCAEQLQCAPPAVVEGEAPAGSKRCLNRRLLETGYRLKYPDFRAGYQPILKELTYNQ